MTGAEVVLLVVLAIVAASAICWLAVAVAARRARPPAGSGRTAPADDG